MYHKELDSCFWLRPCRAGDLDHDQRARSSPASYHRPSLETSVCVYAGGLALVYTPKISSSSIPSKMKKTSKVGETP